MSTTVTVTRDLRSPAHLLYALFAQPIALDAVTGVRVELLEPGGDDGTGVLRRVRMPLGVTLVERIVSLDPEHLVFGYLIEGSRPRFDHESGEITFVERPVGSQVTWRSTLAVPAGRFTPAAESLAGPVAHLSFRTALVMLDRHLARAGRHR